MAGCMRKMVIRMTTPYGLIKQSKRTMKFLVQSLVWHGQNLTWKRLSEEDRMILLSLCGRLEMRFKRALVEVDMIKKHRIWFVGQKKSMTQESEAMLWRMDLESIYRLLISWQKWVEHLVQTIQMVLAMIVYTTDILTGIYMVLRRRQQ